MTGNAPVLLLLALFCAVCATFYRWDGPAPAAGQPFWSGRLYIHSGWLALALYLAWCIWK